MGYCASVQTATKTAAARSLGWRFFVSGGAGPGGLGALPCFNLRQPPAGAAGGQADRFGKGRIGLEPPARGQVVNIETRAKLAVGKVGFGGLQGHEMLHRVVIGSMFR